MSGYPDGEVMPWLDLYKKVKRLRLFEPSVGVLGFFLVTICVVFGFALLDSGSVSKGLRLSSQTQRILWLKFERFGGERKRFEFLSENGGSCDVFEGDWVWDESYPLYHSRDCRFLDEGFRCSENGRPDLFYTKWRWQPKDCDLPRFNAKAMLEKLRSKRLVFVGDSIGRNQWESLLCLLSSVVANKTSIYEVNGSPITKHKGYLAFKFVDYNCTIEYYRAPFLVLQSRPPAGAPGKIRTTLKLDQMDWSSAKWRDADVLIFNSGHWWNYEKTIRGGCYFQEGSELKMDMKVDVAYQKSLQTVVNWIQREVDPNRTLVFFRTYAPVHFRFVKKLLSIRTDAYHYPTATFSRGKVLDLALHRSLSNNIPSHQLMDLALYRLLPNNSLSQHLPYYLLGSSAATFREAGCWTWPFIGPRPTIP